MVYITKNKIFSTLSNIDGRGVQDPVKDKLKDKYFFLSDNKIDAITIFYLFSKDPKKFIEANYIKWKDRNTYIYETRPAFHKDQNCKYLNARFENIAIPAKIKEQLLTVELRQWSYNNRYLFDSNKTSFVASCIKEFNSKYPSLNLNQSDFSPVSKANSGVGTYENYTLEQLKDESEKILTEARAYFEEEKKKKVLEYFRNKIYLGSSTDPINYNPTKIDDENVRQILLEIDNLYIKPITEIIIQICIKKYLSGTEMTTTMLEVLNFKNCKSCFSDYDKSREFVLNLMERESKI